MTEGNPFRDKCRGTTPGTMHREVRVSWEGRKPEVTGGGTNTWTYEVDNAGSKLSRSVSGTALEARTPGTTGPSLPRGGESPH